MINNEYVIAAPALFQASINGLLMTFGGIKAKFILKRILRKMPEGGIMIALKYLFLP